MILNDIKHVEGESNIISTQSSINKSKLKKLFALLSNLYNNPIGSIVREYCSNAHDAANEANSEKPIIVRIFKENSDYYFSVTDWGVGMSKDDLLNVYFNYLDSTKESTNDLIGGFGIGAKSYLSYQNFFEITSTKNHATTSWVMSIGQDGTPESSLMYENTEDIKTPNGTTVKGLINKEDLQTFIDEIQKQLAYMENVFFSLETESDAFNDQINSYTIHEGKYFKIREDRLSGNSLSKIHIVLGCIPYQINFNSIDLPAVQLPIGLKFEIGELQPTPSREDITYDLYAKKLIKERFELAVQEIRELYNKEQSNTDCFVTYLSSLGKSPILNFGSTVLNLKELSKLNYSFHNLNFTPFVEKGIKINAPYFNYQSPIKIFNKKGQAIYVDNTIAKSILAGVFNSFYHHHKNYSVFSTSFSYNSNVPRKCIFEGPYYIKDAGYLRNTKNLEKTDIVIYTYDKVTTKTFKLYKRLAFYKKVLDLKNVPKEKWRDHIETLNKYCFDVLFKENREMLRNYHNVIPHPNYNRPEKKYVRSKNNDVSFVKTQDKIRLQYILKDNKYRKSDTYKLTDLKSNFTKSTFIFYTTNNDTSVEKLSLIHYFFKKAVVVKIPTRKKNLFVDALHNYKLYTLESILNQDGLIWEKLFTFKNIEKSIIYSIFQNSVIERFKSKSSFNRTFFDKSSALSHIIYPLSISETINLSKKYGRYYPVLAELTDITKNEKFSLYYSNLCNILGTHNYEIENRIYNIIIKFQHLPKISFLQKVKDDKQLNAEIFAVVQMLKSSDFKKLLMENNHTYKNISAKKKNFRFFSKLYDNNNKNSSSRNTKTHLKTAIKNYLISYYYEKK